MALGRREILSGLMGIAGTTVWAEPQERAMYGTIGKMTTIAGKRAEVIALLQQAITKMPGCLSYVVAEDSGDEKGLWITEVWDRKDSHDASLTLPEVQKSIAAATPDDYRLHQPSDYEAHRRIWPAGQEHRAAVISGFGASCPRDRSWVVPSTRSQG
jgi:quinol monooxygenase YgiN